MPDKRSAGMSAEALARFIRSHQFPSFVFGGSLFAVGWARLSDGSVSRAIEHIPATLTAVRDWLGY